MPWPLRLACSRALHHPTSGDQAGPPSLMCSEGSNLLLIEFGPAPPAGCLFPSTAVHPFGTDSFSAVLSPCRLFHALTHLKLTA